MLFTGHDPIATYKAIFDGTGLNWFFPWISAEDRTIAALNLQQTLIITTPLILTGLAVAYAFRCGLFNIGGQGQYLVGAIVAVWVGSSFAGHAAAAAHRARASIAACAGGRALGRDRGRAEGGHRRQRGDLDDHAQLDRDLDRRVPVRPRRAAAERHRTSDVPVSNDIVAGAKLPVFWGDPELQGLHIGLFIALAALLVFWVLLNRSTHGLRGARGRLQPRGGAVRRASRSARNYILVMAICGAFAGLAGAIDVLGWQFRDRDQRHPDQPTVGFLGIAVALLGRNTAVGTLLRGAAVRRADQRHVGAQPRPDGLRARAGDEPDATSSRAWSCCSCQRRRHRRSTSGGCAATAHAAAPRTRRRWRHERAAPIRRADARPAG